MEQEYQEIIKLLMATVNSRQPVHCDSRILHAVTDNCDFCKEAVELQNERERLGVSNTGHQNRAWPCPADIARSKNIYNAWPGNRPKTRAQMDEEAKQFRIELTKAMREAGHDDAADGLEMLKNENDDD